MGHLCLIDYSFTRRAKKVSNKKFGLIKFLHVPVFLKIKYKAS